MTKPTFMYLCNQIRTMLQHQDTVFRKAISVEKRVAVTLWCLATCAEYRTIGHLFGIARCTVCVIVHQTVDAIVKTLLRSYIKFPTGPNLENTVADFEKKWHFPCAGAIDGSHIPIRPPALNHTDYYNRKGFYSVILQGVVDANYLFRDIHVGWPGSVHDARVFVNSSLYQKANNKEILQGHVLDINGCLVSPFMVGDSGYPLLSWLVKPYPHNGNLSSQQKTYNYRMSRARIVTENAFGRLKARWRRLAKQNDMEVKRVPYVVAACCVLHNICEIHGEEFDENWLLEVREVDINVPVADETDSQEVIDEDIREILMDYIVTNPIPNVCN